MLRRCWKGWEHKWTISFSCLGWGTVLNVGAQRNSGGGSEGLCLGLGLGLEGVSWGHEDPVGCGYEVWAGSEGLCALKILQERAKESLEGSEEFPILDPQCSDSEETQ